MNAFFKDSAMQFATENALGQSWFHATDVGEVLATIAHIPNGDAGAWVTAWSATADRLAGLAREAETGGHARSAAARWLRASSYYSQASDQGDATGTFTELWERHRDAWDRFADLTTAAGETLIERFTLPYEDTTLPGYVFRTPGTGARRCLIFVNGSDGSVISAWTACAGAAPGRPRLERRADPAAHPVPAGLGSRPHAPDRPHFRLARHRRGADRGARPQPGRLLGAASRCPRAPRGRRRRRPGRGRRVHHHAPAPARLPAQGAGRRRPRQVRPGDGVGAEVLGRAAQHADLADAALRRHLVLRLLHRGRAVPADRRRPGGDPLPDADHRPRARAVLARPVRPPGRRPDRSGHAHAVPRGRRRRRALRTAGGRPARRTHPRLARRPGAGVTGIAAALVPAARSGGPIVNTLSVWTFGTADGAAGALRVIERLQTRRRLSIEDAAVVTWPAGKYRPYSYQAGTIDGTAALSGAFWGLLFGLLFLLPLADPAGAASRPAGLARAGLPDDLLRQLRGTVTAGTSALFLLAGPT